MRALCSEYKSMFEETKGTLPRRPGPPPPFDPALTKLKVNLNGTMENMMRLMKWLRHKLFNTSFPPKVVESSLAKKGCIVIGPATAEQSALIESMEVSIRALREQAPDERRYATVSLHHEPDPVLLPLLLSTIEDEDVYFRASAIYALNVYNLTGTPEISQMLLRLVRSDPDDTVRAAATSVLPRIGREGEHAAIAALSDPCVQVRQEAACVLDAFDGEAVIAALCKCLRSEPDTDVRRHATFSLGKFVDHAIDELIRALHDEHPGVRARAAGALGESRVKDKSQTLVDALIKCLADPEASVREAAAGALCYSMPLAIPALIKALSDTAPVVRMKALIALGSLNAEEAFDAMAACLRNDPDEEVRAYAVGALSDIHSPRVKEHLIRALDDASARVRSSAARDLGWLGARSQIRYFCDSDDANEECDFDDANEESGPDDADEESDQSSVPALCKALADEDADVREAAAEALQRVLDCPKPDWDTALEPLCMAARDPQTSVRAAVIGALGLSRNSRAHALITQALDDEECDIKEQAIESLAKIDPLLFLEQVPRILANPDISLQRAAVKALRKIYEYPLPPEVLSYFSDINSDDIACAELARVIGLNGDPAHVPALLSALSTEDDYLRHSVLQALADVPDRRALPALLACLHHQDDRTRADAALALAAIGDEQAIAPIGKLVGDESPSVRWRAIWALSFFELAKVQALLVCGLKDEDAHVQSIAVEALASVCDAPSLRRILSSLPRSQKEVRMELEEAIATLEQDWGGKPSGEERLVRRGTIHYE